MEKDSGLGLTSASARRVKPRYPHDPPAMNARNPAANARPRRARLRSHDAPRLRRLHVTGLLQLLRDGRATVRLWTRARRKAAPVNGRLLPTLLKPRRPIPPWILTNGELQMERTRLEKLLRLLGTFKGTRLAIAWLKHGDPRLLRSFERRTSRPNLC